MGTHPEASYPLTCAFLFGGLALPVHCLPFLHEAWAVALGSDKWVSYRCGYLNQIPWYAFPLLISLYFLELTVVCLFGLGLPISLGTQPQYPSTAPLLCFISPEMGLSLPGPAYMAPCSSGPKWLGLQPCTPRSVNQLHSALHTQVLPRLCLVPCLDLKGLHHSLLLILEVSLHCPAS